MACPVFPGPDPDELLREHEQRIRDAARDFAWAVGTLEIDDFEQAGRVGAYKAAARWRSDLGPFWAFAASYVRYGMLHELNRQGRTITQPERALKRKDRPAHLVVRMRHEIADSREHGRVFAILGADEAGGTPPQRNRMRVGYYAGEAEGLDPEQALIAKEQSDAIARAVIALPDEQRAVMQLELRGLGTLAIARRLGLGERSVRRRREAALEAIRATLLAAASEDDEP